MRHQIGGHGELVAMQLLTMSLGQTAVGADCSQISVIYPHPVLPLHTSSNADHYFINVQ